MKFYVVTIFPQVIKTLDFSILKIAKEKGLIEIIPVDPRDFTTDKHRTVDDEPYGGGVGMVMKPEPLIHAVESIKEREPHLKSFLLSPQGQTFHQGLAESLARLSAVALVCGRYEGVDERVKSHLTGEISLGDFILAGGEFAAMAIIEAVVRIIPGTLGSSQSLEEESFSQQLLEYPQYTRPPRFRGVGVPQVLLSGNHGEISRWRRFQQVKVTWEKRPDLLAKAPLTDEDKGFLEMVLRGEDPWAQS